MGSECACTRVCDVYKEGRRAFLFAWTTKPTWADAPRTHEMAGKPLLVEPLFDHKDPRPHKDKYLCMKIYSLRVFVSNPGRVLTFPMASIACR